MSYECEKEKKKMKHSKHVILMSHSHRYFLNKFMFIVWKHKYFENIYFYNQMYKTTSYKIFILYIYIYMKVFYIEQNLVLNLVIT